jgi:hypothetical protein
MLKITKRFPQTPAGFPPQPVIRVCIGRQQVYITGFTSVDQVASAEVSLISAEGGITGHVSMRHLDRLGNANHAVRSAGLMPQSHSTFPKGF